jgi:hypothetical protein
MAVIPSGGGGGAGGGSGWIRITDINVPAGVADQKVYQDEAETVLQSCRVSDLEVEVSLKASYPLVLVNNVSTQLAPALDEGHYEGAVPATLPGAGVLQVKVVTPNGADGAEDAATIAYEAPPQFLTLEFTGAYPGAQTELKAGDTFQLTGTTDVPADAVDIQDFGAMAADLKTFVAGTSFTVTGTIADRGNVSQLLSAKARARSAATGAFGPVRDTDAGGSGVEPVNVLRCNNLHPMVVWGNVVYPGGQGALKGSETATVAFSMANADTVSFTSPNGDLSVTNPTLYEDPKTVQRISGSYNDATNNLRATATRAANAAQTTANTLVKIANVAAQITVTEPAARLRSGGSDGTAPQDHTITITSNQELAAAPSMDAAAGAGTWQGGGFAGGPKVWTRALRVLDTDPKGTYAWANLSAVNRAGIPTTVITGDGNYTLGGFVPRSLTFPAFSQSTILGTRVIDYNKLVAGVFTATNQPALRTAVQGDTANYGNRFTVTALGALPTTVWWNDVTAAGTNSSGTAAITNLEETV